MYKRQLSWFSIHDWAYSASIFLEPIPPNFTYYAMYPIYYFFYFSIAYAGIRAWKIIISSDVIIDIDENSFKLNLPETPQTEIKWDDIETFVLKYRRVSSHILEYIVITPKDPKIAQIHNRLAGHDNKDMASFYKWTKSKLGKAASFGIYDPHKQIGIDMVSLNYKPEVIVEKMKYFSGKIDE